MLSTMTIFFKTSEHTVRGMEENAGKSISMVSIFLHDCKEPDMVGLLDVRSFLAWLRENSIHGKPDFWLMYVNRMIQWCGRIECLHFTYVLHDGLWRMSSTWASTKCAVSQVFFQISSKTSKNGLKLGIYFLRVLFWLCELEIGNSGCSDLR